MTNDVILEKLTGIDVLPTFPLIVSEMMRNHREPRQFRVRPGKTYGPLYGGRGAPHRQ